MSRQDRQRTYNVFERTGSEPAVAYERSGVQILQGPSAISKLLSFFFVFVFLLFYYKFHLARFYKQSISFVRTTLRGLSSDNRGYPLKVSLL